MSKENKIKRIVVKVGTSTITHKNGKTNIAKLAKLASVLSDLKNAGYEIILVSSGAIAVGLGRLKLPEKPADIKCQQAAAAVGQCELMFLYDRLFSEYDVVVAQLLFTTNELYNEESKAHLIDAFNQLIQYDTLPIVNENDSVSVDELLCGDNDVLSAIVASLIDADLLVIFTDTDGLYDMNPAQNENAKLISRVHNIDDSIIKAAGAAGEKGTGGFLTKIKAAQLATKNKIPVVIANGEKPTAIYSILNGENVGTYFEVND
ncbi:MAG: glutamate 5-kinase [Clostridiales bacterium]|nr:glutamate 5-kinase [Clostridiales bacterium]